MTDLFEVLATDHRTLERLFAAFENDGNDATVREVCDALTLHAEIEEQVLYPEVRRIVDDGDDLAAVAEAEHAALRSLVARIYETPPPNLTAIVKEVRTLVEQHVRSEETNLFPKLREAGADGEALGRRAEAARDEASSRSAGQAG